MDRWHNLVDAVTYWVQSNDILKRTGISKRALKIRRHISYAAISSTNLMGAAYATYELAHSAEQSANSHAILPSASSLALNGLLVARLQWSKIREHRKLDPETTCNREKDLTKHLLWSDIPSAASAVVGSIAREYGHPAVDLSLAAVIGFMAAWQFRPTTSNMKHGHSH